MRGISPEAGAFTSSDRFTLSKMTLERGGRGNTSLDQTSFVEPVAMTRLTHNNSVSALLRVGQYSSLGFVCYVKRLCSMGRNLE